MPQFLWCYSLVYFSPSRTSIRHNQGSTEKRQHHKGKNSVTSQRQNTYFSFQGQFYEQVEGATMEFPVSPIVTNIYMEYFEQKALSTATHPPRLWHRYVDDTTVIQKEENRQNFLEHINSVDPAIKFTVENNKEDGAKPFLDTTVKPQADGRLSFTIYRKPTHTDQYLQWDSHHHLSAKYSVISTLMHGAKTVCNKPELLQKKWISSGRHSLTASTPHGS